MQVIVKLFHHLVLVIFDNHMGLDKQVNSI